jgi:hypothetical protein
LRRNLPGDVPSGPLGLIFENALGSLPAIQNGNNTLLVLIGSLIRESRSQSKDIYELTRVGFGVIEARESIVVHIREANEGSPATLQGQPNERQSQSHAH